MRIGNWKLLWEVLEHVIAHPDRHNQKAWRSPCGTVRCIAGWTTFLGGFPDVDVSQVDHVPGDIYVLNPLGCVVLPLETAAVQLLDGEDLYGGLFSDMLEFEDILNNVRIAAAEAGVVPPQRVVDAMYDLGVLPDPVWEPAHA